MLPLITIYIPTHNRSVLLSRAIMSVINQSYENIEIIVVDDGSQDNTPEVLQTFVERYKNIIFFRNDVPKGACAARNLAIHYAKGEYISGLDDDDEFLPSHLSTLYKHWDDNYAAVAASLLNDDGCGRTKQGREYGVISLDSLMHYNRVGNQVFTKTSSLRSIDGFDESMPAFQDYDCWVRLSQKYGSILKLKSHTYVLHTAHDFGRISTNQKKTTKGLEIFMLKHQKIMFSKHKKSLRLVTARLLNCPISVTQALSALCLDNWRLVFFAIRSHFMK